MKVLITGGSGLLGQYLNIELSKKNNILSLFNQHTGNTFEYKSMKIDITDFNSLEKLCSGFNPDIIIHTAAITNINEAERITWPELDNVNIQTTKFIAELCSSFSSKLIFTSTDLVYDGNEFRTKIERGRLNPLSLYAESKLHAEEKIMKSNCDYLILRTSLMFGYALNHSMNHFTMATESLKKGEPIKLFVDQFRSQISLREAAKNIALLIYSRKWKEIINFGGPERTSRYNLIKKFAEYYNLNTELIQQVKLAEERMTPKVFDVSLNIQKLEDLLGKINSDYKTSSINQIFDEL